VAPPAVELEVIRTQALAAGGWLERFSSDPSAPAELQRALVELGRCPPATLEAIGTLGGRGRDLVGLLVAVRRDLHDCRFVDTAAVGAEALAVAHRRPPAVQALGPVVSWHLGATTPVERAVLELLGTRRLDAFSPAPRAATLTEVRPCADPDEEVRSALRTIIAAAEAGVPLWQQAVFHPPGPTYARILHQQLAAAGVAGHGPGLHRLDRSVAGRALLGLLDLAGGDWPREEVVGWLSAAPVVVRPGGGPVPASRWDEVSASAGVVRGAGQWRERLGRLVDRGGPDADEASALAAFVDDLFHRAETPGRSWDALSTWAVGLLDRYLPAADDDGRWPVAEEEAARQVRGVVATLGDLDIVSGGADLASFRRALRTQLEATTTDAPERSGGGFGDGVFLAPYASSRGLRYHTVVVAGLADALVPGDSSDGGLLGDDIRRVDTSGTLPTRGNRREALRHDLRCAVAAGGAARIGTLPRGDARTGRAQVPSRWLSDLVDADTHRREVGSFAAGVAAAEPALSARDYELRELDRWTRAGGDPARSPAAGADDRLTRGFAAVDGRADTRFTRFDGYVGPARVSAFDPQTPVSATRFETYARCPRRYLFDRVLRVSERVRPEELWRIEPMTRGTLVHAILEVYVTERVAGAERSLDRLLAIATARLDDAQAGGLVGRPLLWRLDRAAILRDLTRFHAEETDVEPLAAELSFGAGDADTPAVTVVLDDGRSVAFQGSVDRVDRTSSGQLMVSDYKTGRQGRLSDLTRDPVAGGKLIQLPLYAMAALDRFGGRRPVHARYWLLSGERSAPCFHLVVTPDVEARFRHVVGLIADAVESGCFPGVPGAPTNGRFANCTGCDFDHVCPTSRDREWGRQYNRPELRGVVTLVNGDVPDGLAGSVVKRFVDPDDGPPT
jgi:hypothetical protein